MRFRTLALVVLAALVSCARKPSTDLKNAVGWAQGQPPCSTTVPGEWSPSFPVPSDDPGGRKFKIFFYAIEGAPPHDPVLYEPHGEALVDADTHAPISCSMWPVKANPIQAKRWPDAMRGLDSEQFEKRSDRLFDLTEKIGRAYAAKRTPPTAEDLSVAKEFIERFTKIAEPAYLASYYRLNPAFWEWLRSIVGHSIPKA